MRPRRTTTEAALSLLIASRRQLPVGEATSRARISAVVSLGSVDAPDVLRELALFRMVSIVEAFVNVLYIEMLTERLYPLNDLIQKMLVEVEIGASSNWQKRQEAFTRYHGLNLASCSHWEDLQAAVEVRNAVAHGLGRLTPRQRAKSGLASKVERIGVTVGDGRFYVSDVSLERVETASRAFIWSVDSKTQ